MDPRLTVAFVSLLMSTPSLHHRYKRVINGVPFKGRPSSYEVIKYSGAFATPHTNVNIYARDLPKEVWESLTYTGGRGSVLCSGTLITPEIFQTACHCVADFDVGSRQTTQPSKVKNHWEDNTVVYLGVSSRFDEVDSMATTNYVLTKKYIIDSRCGRFNSYGSVVTHDYGIVVIDSDFLKGEYPWDEISWAPQYTSQAIVEFHRRALEQQLTCLHIGFGYYLPKGPYFTSHLLRHGWQVLFPRGLCLARTKTFPDLDSYNWVCTSNFSLHFQGGGSGDSGGPLTCDNKYFGVLSGRMVKIKRRDNSLHNYVTLTGALRHSLYVNSVNYRTALMNSIHQLQETYREIVLNPRRDGGISAERQFFHWQDSKSALPTSRGLQLRHNLYYIYFAILLHSS